MIQCDHKHDQAYHCLLCDKCCPCTHKYKEIDGRWWVRCRNKMWRLCIPMWIHQSSPTQRTIQSVRPQEPFQEISG